MSAKALKLYFLLGVPAGTVTFTCGCPEAKKFALPTRVALGAFATTTMMIAGPPMLPLLTVDWAWRRWKQDK